MATLYESYIGTITTATSCYGVHWKWQSFTPQISHTMTSAKLYLAKQGSPGNLTVSVRATTGNVPSGIDLGSGTILEADLSVIGGLVEVVFETSLLVKDFKYALIWRALTGDISNYVRTSMDSNALYARGTFGDSDDDGENWYDYEENYDAPFEEYGAPSGELAGLYAVVEERFHYVDAYGVERFIQGTPV